MSSGLQVARSEFGQTAKNSHGAYVVRLSPDSDVLSGHPGSADLCQEEEIQVLSHVLYGDASLKTHLAFLPNRASS
jgi:hypothetical protein